MGRRKKTTRTVVSAEMTAIEIIQEYQDELTNTQKDIAKYILENPLAASYASLQEMSAAAAVSEVSLLRFCKVLGFERFIDFKDSLRDYVAEVFPRRIQERISGINCDRLPPATAKIIRGICSDDLQNLRYTMEDLNAEMLFRVAEKLLQADEVLVFAHDATTLFADYLSYRLNFLRIRAQSVPLGNNDSVQTTLARLKQGDHVILLSFPPYFQPAEYLTRYCLYRNTPITVISDSKTSPAFAEEVDFFHCHATASFYYNSHAATCSFINILCSCIAILMGPRFHRLLAEEQAVVNFMKNDSNGAVQES